MGFEEETYFLKKSMECISAVRKLLVHKKELTEGFRSLPGKDTRESESRGEVACPENRRPHVPAGKGAFENVYTECISVIRKPVASEVKFKKLKWGEV